MAETHHESGPGGDIDLSQFYQISLKKRVRTDLMEQMLLNLQLETADDES